MPYSAGGIADLIARLCGRVLSGKFGQPFVVDDRPGANGVLATTAVAKAAADGYTLLLSTPGQMVTEPLLQKVAYDPDQFASISIVASFPLLLAIKSSLPAKTVSEFIAYAKANPGKLNYASGGTGAVTHLVTALFASRAGLEIVHVPYKGSAPATAALISGEVDLFFGTSSEIIPQLLSGRIRVLATSGAKRFSLLPDVPTISETFPGFKLDPWNKLLATPGTPRDIVGRIAEALISATEDSLDGRAVGQAWRVSLKVQRRNSLPTSSLTIRRFTKQPSRRLVSVPHSPGTQAAADHSHVHGIIPHLMTISESMTFSYHSTKPNVIGEVRIRRGPPRRSGLDGCR